MQAITYTFETADEGPLTVSEKSLELGADEMKSQSISEQEFTTAITILSISQHRTRFLCKYVRELLSLFQRFKIPWTGYILSLRQLPSLVEFSFVNQNQSGNVTLHLSFYKATRLYIQSLFQHP